MTTAISLPQGFEDLEQFSGWALPTETARNEKRLASTQADIEAFAHTMLPRLEAICAHLNGYELASLPPGPQALLLMMLSVAEVSLAVESYHSPTVPDGYDSRRFRAQEDFVLRPLF